jgi:hypothetical protein
METVNYKNCFYNQSISDISMVSVDNDQQDCIVSLYKSRDIFYPWGSKTEMIWTFTLAHIWLYASLLIINVVALTKYKHSLWVPWIYIQAPIVSFLFFTAHHPWNMIEFIAIRHNRLALSLVSLSLLFITFGVIKYSEYFIDYVARINNEKFQNHIKLYFSDYIVPIIISMQWLLLLGVEIYTLVALEFHLALLLITILNFLWLVSFHFVKHNFKFLSICCVGFLGIIFSALWTYDLQDSNSILYRLDYYRGESILIPILLQCILIAAACICEMSRLWYIVPIGSKKKAKHEKTTYQALQTNPTYFY